MQVNWQSEAESTAKKDGLPASTEIILNETFSDFFGAKYVQIGQGGKATFLVPCLSCKRLFSQACFRPKIVNRNDGRGIFVAFFS